MRHDSDFSIFASFRVFRGQFRLPQIDSSYFLICRETCFREKRRLGSSNEALDGGSQTAVGIAPGIRHEFKDVAVGDLRTRLDEYDYALFLIDPAIYENPYARPGITRGSFC